MTFSTPTPPREQCDSRNAGQKDRDEAADLGLGADDVLLTREREVVRAGEPAVASQRAPHLLLGLVQPVARYGLDADECHAPVVGGVCQPRVDRRNRRNDDVVLHAEAIAHFVEQSHDEERALVQEDGLLHRRDSAEELEAHLGAEHGDLRLGRDVFAIEETAFSDVEVAYRL